MKNYFCEVQIVSSQPMNTNWVQIAESSVKGYPIPAKYNLQTAGRFKSLRTFYSFSAKNLLHFSTIWTLNKWDEFQKYRMLHNTTGIYIYLQSMSTKFPEVSRSHSNVALIWTITKLNSHCEKAIFSSSCLILPSNTDRPSRLCGTRSRRCEPLRHRCEIWLSRQPRFLPVCIRDLKRNQGRRVGFVEECWFRTRSNWGKGQFQLRFPWSEFFYYFFLC